VEDLPYWLISHSLLRTQIFGWRIKFEHAC
jgi:hypothetical protein